MEFQCVDLPQYGVALVPPTSPEYDYLFADIRTRVDHQAAGSPPALARVRTPWEDRETSAILVNRGPRAIAQLQLVWEYEEVEGRRGRSAIGGGGGSTSVLLPFGLDDRTFKLYGYWHVILPGSKRYVNMQGDQLGDNTDVRPPAGDEIWKGGVISGGVGNRVYAPMKQVKLTVDGVFFTDGSFAGPNEYQMWEQVTASAEAHLEIARIAKQGHFEGRAPAEILADIEKLTGPSSQRPAPPPPRRGWTAVDYRRWALESLAWPISEARKSVGDERTIYMLSDWADDPVPKFKKL